MAVNGLMLKNNINQWLHYFASAEEITLTINSNEQLKNISLQKDKKGNTYFFNPLLTKKEDKATSIAFDIWKKL